MPQTPPDDDDVWGLPELPDIPEDFPPNWTDDLAVKEASAVADEDDLAKQAKRNDHGRGERLKDHLVIAAIGGFWIGATLFLVALLTLAWHMIAPHCWVWLEEQSVNQLKALLGGVLVSGGLQSYVKKYVK